MAEESFSELHWACFRGDMQAVQALLVEAGRGLSARVDDVENESGASPLMWAAMSGSVGIVEMLANAGADICAKDKFGQTALMHAAQNGHVVVAHVLLERGADVNVRDKEAHSLLHWSAYRNDCRMTAYLLNRQCDGLESADVNGARPLHWAALRGHARVVALLLEYGANRLVRDVNGKTPLQLAQDGEHRRAAAELAKTEPPLSAAEKDVRRYKFFAVACLGVLVLCGLTEFVHWALFFVVIPIAYLLVTRGWLAQHVVGLDGFRSGAPYGVMVATCIVAVLYFWAYFRAQLEFFWFETGICIILMLLFVVKTRDPGRLAKNSLGSVIDWTCSDLCAYCMAPTSLRARHCRRCDACVEILDHHCPWLDVCIGRGNQRFFLLLLVWTACMHCFWLWLAYEHLSGLDSPQLEPALCIYFVWQFAQMVMTAVLAWSQLKAMVYNTTMLEQQSKENVSRFDQGCYQNTLSFWQCGAVTTKLTS